MNEELQATSASKPADSHNSVAVDPAKTGKSNRWSLQFGVLELHGLLISIAVWYFLIIGVFHNPVRAFRRYGPPPPPPLAPIELRVRAFLMGTLVALGGSYLACRVATERGMGKIWQRLVNQAFYVFLVVPILVIVAEYAFLFCAIPFL